MSIVLYGSRPSPYVRRIRMFLDDVDYRFEEIDVYGEAGRAYFSKISPIMKLPLLVDNNREVFDSHVIANHVRKLRGLPEFTIEEHNLISIVDAVTDSLIILFMGRRSGFSIDKDALIFKLQLERIPSSLAWLNQRAAEGVFDQWGYPVIALISLIGWAQFRDLYDFSGYPELLKVVEKTHASRSIVQETAPE